MGPIFKHPFQVDIVVVGNAPIMVCILLMLMEPLCSKDDYLGINTMIRYQANNLYVARKIMLHKMCSPLEFKLFAVKEALNQVFNVRYNNGVITADSRIVANLVNSSSSFLSKECFLLIDISLLLNRCPRTSCKFTFREANKAAYVVAKHVVFTIMSACWFYKEPLQLAHILYYDLQLYF